MLYFNRIDIFNEFLPKIIFKNITNFKSFVLSLIDPIKIEFKVDDFSKRLFSLLNKNNSGLVKQVLKQKFKNFNDIEEWRDLYYLSGTSVTEWNMVPPRTLYYQN